MQNDSKKLIFTEDIDYSQTGTTSIWGEGDPETLTLLQKLVSENKISGYWLNFAAGDGRYNNLLLSSVNRLLATDIDLNALEKLKSVTPRNLVGKLTTAQQNITELFPFADKSFDGVFNTGTLHLFPKDILSKITGEVARVLKQRGLYIFDFATDVKRERSDGTLVGRSEIVYEHEETREIFSKLLKQYNFEFEFIAGTVPPEEVTSGDGTYLFSCNYWIIVATKL